MENKPKKLDGLTTSHGTQEWRSWWTTRAHRRRRGGSGSGRYLCSPANRHGFRPAQELQLLRGGPQIIIAVGRVHTRAPVLRARRREAAEPARVSMSSAVPGGSGWRCRCRPCCRCRSRHLRQRPQRSVAPHAPPPHSGAVPARVVLVRGRLAPTSAHRRPSGSATLWQPHRRCALEPRACARTRRGRAQPWPRRLGDAGSAAGDSVRWGLGRSSWRGSRGLLLERTMAGERQP